MGYQSVPYIVSLFSAMLWMYYAFLKKNAPLLISINSIGCVIETIYISIFLAYASKNVKRQTVKMLFLLVGGLYSVILLGTMFPFKGTLRASVVGWICVAFSVCVFAAPLTILFQVVKTKSVEFMPFNLSFFLTLTAVMWFGYGLLLKDMCIAIPNVLGFVLGMLQMVLYGIYKNKKMPAEVVDEKKGCAAAAADHVINVESPPGTSDQELRSFSSNNPVAGVEKAAVAVTSENSQEEKCTDTLTAPPPPLPPAHPSFDDLVRAHLGRHAGEQPPIAVVCAA
ncbi:unnamed protein product [Cuscuta campestris]|uniref:Bidirectional sugar transporter SWEET n=1 Tax=Cuscuta campestris TaxID=132261 RepID=A0A484MRJ2_9ASTE|nr:unnamed protein product [Cuscuta campestris]